MSADSKEKKLPSIQGVRWGALFNSQTGQLIPPRETPSFSSKKLKEPRTWMRWTVVRTGPDLYRALHDPYPLALKVLAGQAPEPDVPLMEWRHALSSPNCRALLLQAGTETMLEYKLPPSTETLNLLLLGKTGHGKSSTGNTILQLPDAFESSGDTMGTTAHCKVRIAKVDGQTFKVVDTPGIFDPSNFRGALEEICTAITLCTEDFHAVLIVWKYGTKLTPEEIKSVECLKKVFGEDLLENHGIFLMTNGDQFEGARQRKEHNHESFEAWSKEQMNKDMKFQSLVGECKGRYTLFDNTTEDAKKKKKQLLELVDIVGNMRKRQGYGVLTTELFKIAKKNLDKLQTKELKEHREKALKLNKKIDAILRAAEKLTPVEQEEIEKKLRSIRGYQLNLLDSINITTNGLDRALDDARNLQTDVKGRVSQSTSQAETEDFIGESIAVESFRKLTAQTDKTLAASRKAIQQKERMASDAGKVTAEESGISCFPGNATVRLQDGRQIKMTSLQEGDVVLCGKQDGSLTYSAVYMFGHRDEFFSLHCLALSTRTVTLRFSHDHLVFRRHLGCCTAASARHVQVGDDISVYSPGAATLQWEPVTHIQTQWERGVMAPFTLEGTVVVDDVLASCYVAVTSHALCHALLWPVRKLAVLAPGLSAHLHRPGEGAVPPWVRLCLHHLLPWLPHHRSLSA